MEPLGGYVLMVVKTDNVCLLLNVQTLMEEITSMLQELLLETMMVMECIEKIFVLMRTLFLNTFVGGLMLCKVQEIANLNVLMELV